MGMGRILWRSLRLYWLDSTQRQSACGLLVLLLFLSIGSSAALIWETIERGNILSALAAQDGERFIKSIAIFIGLLVASVLLLSCKVYIQERLGLNWRNWLTHKTLGQYLQPYSFYRLQNPTVFLPLYQGGIKGGEPIDNPDQRISDDLKTVCQDSLVFLTILFDSAVQLIGFASVLWLISKSLMGILVTYAVIGTVVTTVVFGKVLLGINRERLQKEADFRYSLIRVREQAEAIAFYQGSQREYGQSKTHFLEAYRTVQRLIRWQFGLTIFQNGYQYLTFILPFIILAPQIFAGDQEVGTVVQSQAAFERIGFALGLIITQFDKLSAFGAAIKRLDGLNQALDSTDPRVLKEPWDLSRPTPSPSQEGDRSAPPLQLSNSPTSQLSTQNPKSKIQNLGIQNLKSKIIRFDHLTLTTSTKTLVHDLSLEVAEGRSLLITGPSGVGKSSLVKAIAGLWQLGEGAIAVPPREQLLFLPQRPYMPLGNLRYQLRYPHDDPRGPNQVSNAQLKDILVQVNLAHLTDYLINESTPAEKEDDTDWSQILSLGEQQRLAIARLLLNPPTYAILDEATSALDDANEALVYQLLRTLPTTLISIGHRPSLIAYHQTQLILNEDATWDFKSIP